VQQQLTSMDRIATTAIDSGPVGLGHFRISPAKTTEPIETPFGLLIQVCPRNHVIDGSVVPPGEGVILRGKWRLIVKYRDTTVSYAKIANNNG